MLWEFEYENGRYLNTLDKEFFVIFFQNVCIKRLSWNLLLNIMYSSLKDNETVEEIFKA